MLAARVWWQNNKKTFVCCANRILNKHDMKHIYFFLFCFTLCLFFSCDHLHCVWNIFTCVQIKAVPVYKPIVSILVDLTFARFKIINNKTEAEDEG